MSWWTSFPGLVGRAWEWGYVMTPNCCWQVLIVFFSILVSVLAYRKWTSHLGWSGIPIFFTCILRYGGWHVYQSTTNLKHNCSWCSPVLSQGLLPKLHTFTTQSQAFITFRGAWSCIIVRSPWSYNTHDIAVSHTDQLVLLQASTKLFL